ncbi:uncharacterized protein F5147DRAFT_771412 [Suillus discolor]|uniref:Uncharacterized protein n=1 Tax=Suillus discolor TaxID=1912936 RepID=A0A9P7FD23_9AGAM|nr:uncharacterized protein F5147DRAFT_771412 [Suillus discolor]KAG2112348.1 hypothetical protein F5147DRAFT_771412 [Suillus discolor]
MNPNLAIAPDFQLPEYTEARAQLVNEAINDRQAATILANLWHIQNDADKRLWTIRLKAEAREAEAERREATEEEAQSAIKEECKKNKAKYALVKDIEITLDPIILPCQYATWKMKSGDYCELFYFTNSSLEEASRSAFTADKDALVILPSSDGLHKCIPAGAAKDPKVQVIKDENLTWE